MCSGTASDAQLSRRTRNRLREHFENRFLTLEIVVERGPAHADRIGDVVEARAVEASFDEKARRHFKDVFAQGVALGLGSGHTAFFDESVRKNITIPHSGVAP